MKSPFYGPLFPALFLALGACRHAPPVTEPKPAPPPAPPVVTAPLLESLDLPKLKNMCLGYAMSPLRMMPADAAPEEQREIAFENYYRAFINVKEQTKYADCLKEDGSPKALEDREKALGWIKSSQAALDSSMKYFPEEKRIADAAETYSNVDEKKGRVRVVVTFRDGTKRTIDRFFDRLPSRP